MQPGQYTSAHGVPATVAVRIVGDHHHHQTSLSAAICRFQRSTAEHGIKTGDVILDIAGKTVSKPENVRQELASLHKDGKRSVLMRVKSGDATKFVAVPLAKA